MKEIIEGSLGCSLILISLLAFAVFHWTSALGLLFAPFILVPIMSLLAKPVARRLLRQRVGFGNVLIRRPNMRDVVEGRQSLEQYIEKHNTYKRNVRRQLQEIAEQQAISKILSLHNIGPSDFQDFYQILVDCNLSDIALEILSNPDELHKFIQLKASGHSREEIFMSFKFG